MPNLELDDIPSGYTPTIQPRDLPGLSTVGSPISATYASGVYSFDVTALTNADYEVELIGVSVPTRRFYMRKTTSAAFIIASPGSSSIPPPDAPSTCRVRIVSTQNGVPYQARLQITATMTGRESARAFTAIAFDAETDEDGEALVDLAWTDEENGIGAYRFRLFDLTTGAVIHDRTAIVPETDTADYADLEDA